MENLQFAIFGQIIDYV